MERVARIRELLAAHVEPPASDDAPLTLSSFELVVLVEALEDAFGVRVRPADVTPEHFGSVARIAALVARLAP